jgi:hypothetical protein
MSFPATYGGETESSNGEISIYSVPAGSSALASAFAPALASSGLSSTTGAGAAYTMVPVAHPYQQLANLTEKIATDEPQLSAQGIRLASWGPDIANNTVGIDLQQYSPSATAALQDRYGAGLVSIATTSNNQLPVRDYGRYTDRTPYFAGDGIWFNGQGPFSCSQGFAYTGNHSGNTYELTAGHCEGSRVYTNGSNYQEIGPVTTNYFNSSGGYWDVESYLADAAGYAWIDQFDPGATVPIVGTLSPMAGDITTDGAATGYEVRYVTIQQYDKCVEFADGKVTCHLTIAHATARTTCQGGDSGGPAYQHAATGPDVYAVGIIIGSSDFDQTCYYQDINSVLTLVNGTLVTGFG